MGLANVGTGAGQVQQNLYPIRIILNQMSLGLDYSQVIGADLSGTGFIALLGRDLLSRMILIYDGLHGEYTLAY